MAGKAGSIVGEDPLAICARKASSSGVVGRSFLTRTESRYLDRPSASTGASIDVCAVVDRDDLDHMPFLVDPIKDAVLTAPSSP